MVHPLKNILNFSLPSWAESISFATRAISIETSSQELLARAKGFIASPIQSIFPRDLPPLFRNPFQPSEGYLDRLKPTDPKFLEKNLGAPILWFLGISALLHGLLGIGTVAAESGEAPTLKTQVNKRREKLIAEAQDALEKKKSDPQFRPDLTDFLISTETVGDLSLSDAETETKTEKLKDKFENYRRGIEKLEKPIDQVYLLASQLYYDFFHHYARAYPNLKNFLEHEMGNCVAQTKMFFAAYSQAGISLPEEFGLGIQVFKNHIQPVLYHHGQDGKIDWVQNLISGHKENSVSGAIYHPEIVLVGFLEKQGESTPLSFQNLLVDPGSGGPVDAVKFHPEIEIGSYIETQPIAWPDSDVNFPGGAPEDAVLPPPVFKEQVQGNEDLKGSFSPKDAGNLGIKSPPTSDTKKILLGSSPSIPYRLFSEGPTDLQRRWIDVQVEHEAGITVLYFRTAQQRDQYFGLKTPEEKKDFFLKLAKASLRRLEDTEEFRKTEFVLKNPLKNFPNFEEKDQLLMREFFSGLWQINRFFQKMDILVGEHKGESISPLEGEKIFSGLPRWQKLHRNIQSFRDLIRNNPKDIILMLNQMQTSKARHEFLFGVHSLRDYYSNVEEDEEMSLGLIDWITDPLRVGYTEKSEQQTPFIPPPKGPYEYLDQLELETLIEVKMLGSEEITAPEAPVMDQGLLPIKPSNPQEPQILVSPQTMIDLLLYGPRTENGYHPDGDTIDSKYFARWDGGLSRAFLESHQGPLDPTDHGWLPGLIPDWLKRGIAKQDPQNADYWGFILGNRGGGPPVPPIPEGVEKCFGKYLIIKNSPHWKAYLPPHLVPVVNKMEENGVPFFKQFPGKPPKPFDKD